ncbi:MAG: hypothetical protein VKJ06_08060 [Vampirovibrionales bacterium]|nr:hypothetical protein [Vampirovibrionales bacterium]
MFNAVKGTLMLPKFSAKTTNQKILNLKPNQTGLEAFSEHKTTNPKAKLVQGTTDKDNHQTIIVA